MLSLPTATIESVALAKSLPSEYSLGAGTSMVLLNQTPNAEYGRSRPREEENSTQLIPHARIGRHPSVLGSSIREQPLHSKHSQ